MNPLLARLDKWLSKKRRRFHKNLQPGASVQQLDALAKCLGKSLPSDLRDLLSWHNGQGDEYVGYFVDHWLLMDASRIAAAKKELDESAGEYGWSENWLPFLDDDGGNYVVVDLIKKDSPVLVFWTGEKADPLAASLHDWLSDFVTGVEAGKYLEDPERGTFTRSKK